MIKQIVFEWMYRKNRPAGYIYALVFGLAAFFVSAAGNFSGPLQVNLFSGYSLANTYQLFSLIAIFIASAIMSVPLYRDIENKTADNIFTLPIKESHYFFGRYIGALTYLILIFFFVGMGIYLGSLSAESLGWTDKVNIGTITLLPVVTHFFNSMVPNLFITGTVFFAVMAIFRHIQVLYVSGFIFFVMYMISGQLLSNLDNQSLASLLDPLGLSAYWYETKFQTPTEMNDLGVYFKGKYMQNRLIWVGVALALLFISYLRFSFRTFRSFSQSKAGVIYDEVVGQKGKPNFTIQLPSTINYIFSSVRIYLTQIVREPLFISMIFLSLIIAGFILYTGNEIYETPSYPLTYNILKAVTGGVFFYVIILIIYSGELIHKDRTIRFNLIADSLPYRTATGMISKWLTLVILAVILTMFMFCTGILWQIFNGFYDVKLDFYAGYLFSFLFDLVGMVTFLFAIHSFIKNKFLGHAVAVAFLIGPGIIASITKFSHNLVYFGDSPFFQLSDLAGFVPAYWPTIMFQGYWLLFGVLVFLLAYLFWRRGTDTGWAYMKAVAGQRWSDTTFKIIAIFSVAGFLGLGSFLYYNTNILNEFVTTKTMKADQIYYEKMFKKYEDLPVPRFVHADLDINIYNSQRKWTLKVKAKVVNDSKIPIDSIFYTDNPSHSGFRWNDVELKPDVMSKKLYLGESSANYFIVSALPSRMMPGDTVDIEYYSEQEVKGIPHDDNNFDVLKNNSLLRFSLTSLLGYQASVEWEIDKDRKEAGLQVKKEDIAPHTDQKARMKNFLGTSGLITLNTKVSVDPGLVAVVPGNLTDKGEQNGRPYFIYKMERPMMDFFNISVGKYEVSQDMYKGENGESIALHLYHHPSHNYNVSSFFSGLKDGLNYYQKAFGPFPHKEIRIIEFPGYSTSAQSFAMTIPFSEGFGWVADLRDTLRFDYAYYVTAHELAHQWWGHQLIPAKVQGGNLLSESLSEYSAIMVSEKRFGRERIGKFLKINLDEYLSGRRAGRLEETAYVNSQAPYQEYKKGAVVFYGMRHYIGEEWLNGHLKRFLQAHYMLESGPYPAGIDLYQQLKADCPDSLKYLLEDYWEHLCLYDLEVKESNASFDKSKNQYNVEIAVEADKKYFTGKGDELPEVRPMDDLIEIVVYGEPVGKRDKNEDLPVIYRKMYRLKKGEHRISVKVNQKPFKAGIDPFYILIDREPENNIKTIMIN